VGVAFNVTLDLIGYLIPMPIFGKLIHRRLINHARYEIRKNISRLTASWSDKTSKAMHEMKRQAIAHLQTEIRTLLDLAQKPTTEMEVFTEYLRRIDYALKTLKIPHYTTSRQTSINSNPKSSTQPLRVRLQQPCMLEPFLPSNFTNCATSNLIFLSQYFCPL